MRNAGNAGLLRISIFLFLALHIACSNAASLMGRTVRVIDGDTIVILNEADTQYKIRLKGIDAPEKRQPFGKRSKQYLSDLVAKRYVKVEYTKRDRYGRIIGKVFVSDKDVCLEMISAGLAWHYKKYQSEQSKQDRTRYAETELAASMSGIGLWRDASPIPPWEWRHRRRK
jgi:endonuclease YncB( thermonuclease family)